MYLYLLAILLCPFYQIKWFELLQPALISYILKAPGHLHSSLLHILLEVGCKKMDVSNLEKLRKSGNFEICSFQFYGNTRKFVSWML